MKEERLYTITLADGTIFSDLKLNGNNFISKELVSAEVFVDNCDPVIISNGETEETHEHMALVHVQKIGDDYYFVLRDRTPEELKRLKMQADIEYLAMMADVEL